MKRLSKFLLLTALFALPLAGCGNSDTTSNKDETKKLVTEVTLNEQLLTLEVGESFTLVPSIKFSDEGEHEDFKGKWTTNDINVCSVEEGVVTALGSGETYVSYIAGYKMATCFISVPSGEGTTFTIKISETTKQLTVGEQFKLEATYSPKDTQVTLAWNSSDSTIVSVDQQGNLTGVAIGEADVGVSALGQSASCHVTVLDASDASIKLNASNVDIALGGEFQLTATVKDSTEAVTWTSSDTELGTVSETGLVKANELNEGTFTVTAKSGEASASCVFNVISEEDVYNCSVYFFIDYNNIDPTDKTGTKLLASFRWKNNEPISLSGKVPNNPTAAMDPAFPYFIGWSSHTIIDSKNDLWNMDKDVVGNSPYQYLYGIWSDVPVGEFTK